MVFEHSNTVKPTNKFSFADVTFSLFLFAKKKKQKISIYRYTKCNHSISAQHMQHFNFMSTLFELMPCNKIQQTQICRTPDTNLWNPPTVYNITPMADTIKSVYMLDFPRLDTIMGNCERSVNMRTPREKTKFMYPPFIHTKW